MIYVHNSANQVVYSDLFMYRTKIYTNIKEVTLCLSLSTNPIQINACLSGPFSFHHTVKRPQLHVNVTADKSHSTYSIWLEGNLGHLVEARASHPSSIQSFYLSLSQVTRNAIQDILMLAAVGPNRANPIRLFWIAIITHSHMWNAICLPQGLVASVPLYSAVYIDSQVL